MKLGYYFNLTHNIPVKFLQIIGRNPIFPVNRTADCMDSVSAQEFGADSKACDIACIAQSSVFCVPVSRDLRGVFFIQYRVKDWLSGQSGRKRCAITFLDEIKFLLSDWPVSCHCLAHITPCRTRGTASPGAARGLATTPEGCPRSRYRMRRS